MVTPIGRKGSAKAVKVDRSFDTTCKREDHSPATATFEYAIARNVYEGGRALLDRKLLKEPWAQKVFEEALDAQAVVSWNADLDQRREGWSRFSAKLVSRLFAKTPLHHISRMCLARRRGRSGFGVAASRY